MWILVSIIINIVACFQSADPEFWIGPLHRQCGGCLCIQCLWHNPLAAEDSKSWQNLSGCLCIQSRGKTYLASGISNVVAKPILLLVYSTSWQNPSCSSFIQSRGKTYLAALLPVYNVGHPDFWVLIIWSQGCYKWYLCSMAEKCTKDVVDGASARALVHNLPSIQFLILILKPLHNISIKYIWVECIVYLWYFNSTIYDNMIKCNIKQNRTK